MAHHEGAFVPRWPLKYVGSAAAGVVLVALAVGVMLFGPYGVAPAVHRSAPLAAGPGDGPGGGPGPTGPGSAPPSGSPSGSPTAAPPASPSAAATTPPRPTTPPPPAPGAKPGPGNTGVPAGTALKVVTGDQTYRTDNQVISGLDIHGFVTITAKNVTLKNSIIRGGTPRCNSAVLYIVDGASAKVSDTEITATNPSPCLDGIWAMSVTLTRMNIHSVVDGVKAFNNVVLQDSYVHDLSEFDNDPNQGGGPTHNDCVQTYEGNHTITLRHNTLDAGSDGNAAYQLSQDGGQRAYDIHVENNWLDGGGCTLNFAHHGGPTPMTDIHVVNNRFGRKLFYKTCPILVSTQTTISQSGNVWDNTGAPIPAPQRHD